MVTAGHILGDLITAMKTKRNAILTNQKSVLLLYQWPRTIAKTMETVKKFITFFLLIVLFLL